MKTFLTAVLLFAVALPAFAGGRWQRFYQDIKLPTQVMIEHQSWAAPKLGSSIVLLAAGAASSAAPTTFTSFAAQPDFARNIVITPTGTTANVGAGTAVVSGTNIFGQPISENFAIGAAQSTATTGAHAFLTVTSVMFPQATGAGVTVNVVAGAKLGTRACSSIAGDYAWSAFNGAYDGTRGTYVPGTGVIDSNTFQSNSALNGVANVDLFYVQNYQCFSPNGIGG